MRPYGYSGRGLIAGVAFFMIWRGTSSGYYGYCNRYGSESRERCRNRYQCSFTDATNTTERCAGTTASDITRDDILISGFQVRDAVFPLTLTITKVATVLNAGVAQLEEWDTPLWYSFSEVEVGPGEEGESLLGLFIFLGILGTACSVVCLYVIYSFCCGGSSNHTEVELQGVDSRRTSVSSVYGSRRVSRNTRNSNASSVRYPSPPNAAAYPGAPPVYSVEPPPPMAIPVDITKQDNTGFSSPVPVMAEQVHPAPALPPVWQSVPEVDPNTGVATGRVYYHNTATGETRW